MSVVQRDTRHTRGSGMLWSTGNNLFYQREPNIKLVYDVVCGMSEVEGLWTSTCMYRGKTYSFCCEDCKSAFEKSPEYYLSKFAEEQPGIEPVPED